MEVFLPVGTSGVLILNRSQQWVSKMSNTRNGDLGQFVLNALINIAENSKKVTKVNLDYLSRFLNLTPLVLTVAVKKLHKQGLLDIIFDENELYFKLTNLCFEV